MDTKVCLLVTLLYKDTILKVAMKLEKNLFVDDCYLEPENRVVIYDNLPLHAKYPVIAVEEIFECV